jgi:hypothetical protein
MKGYTPAGRWVTEVEVEGEPVRSGARSRSRAHRPELRTTKPLTPRPQGRGVWAYALAGSPTRIRDHKEAYAPVGAMIAERTTSKPPAIPEPLPKLTAPGLGPDRTEAARPGHHHHCHGSSEAPTQLAQSAHCGAWGVKQRAVELHRCGFVRRCLCINFAAFPLTLLHLH